MILSDYIVDELITFAKNTMPKTPRRMIALMRQTLEQYIHGYDEDYKTKVRDINDLPILQVAIHHKAFIVASDKDLLEYRGEAKVAIVSVAEYCELFDL